MKLGTTAVVLGGSAAGLCAAGALSAHFDQVLVLERDELPAEAVHRRGVPQSKHPHFLLNSGRRAIGELFPGFENDLIAAGGLHLMPSMDAAYLDREGWSARKRSAMTMIYGSRILIERVLRDKVRELADVTIREGVTVCGLTTTKDQVIGVETADGKLAAILSWTRWAAAHRWPAGWPRRAGRSPRCGPWTPRSPTPPAGTNCPHSDHRPGGGATWC